MKNSTEIRVRAMTLERIDTHSHFQAEIPDLGEASKLFADFATLPHMVDSRLCAIGCRNLYGIDPGIFLRPDAPSALFDAAASLRARGPGVALESALDEENITTQLCFSGPNPQVCTLPDLSSRVRLLAYIDPVICGNDFAFCPDGRGIAFNYYESLCGQLGPLNSIDDYLGAMDVSIDAWRQRGVVGMKTALAYTLGLRFSDPDYAQARTAFSRKADMSSQDVTVVQHHAFRHALLACKRNSLPVVVHTGFQIWGHADLQQSNPILLHNLLIDERYRGVCVSQEGFVK